MSTILFCIKECSKTARMVCLFILMQQCQSHCHGCHLPPRPLLLPQEEEDMTRPSSHQGPCLSTMLSRTTARALLPGKQQRAEQGGRTLVPPFSISPKQLRGGPRFIDRGDGLGYGLTKSFRKRVDDTPSNTNHPSKKETKMLKLKP